MSLVGLADRELVAINQQTKSCLAGAEHLIDRLNYVGHFG
jgi:hypothetical protein